MTAQSTLMCQIIPVKAGNLLIPDMLVEDVVLLEETDSQNSLIWRNRKVPITSNDNFNKVTTRVSILKTVMGHKGLPYIAIPTDGIPYSVSIDSTTLGDVPEENRSCSIAAGFGRVGSLDCAILDFPKLESRMRANV